MPSGLEIESGDVIRLILQFLKENNLEKSVEALENETGIPLNMVDSVDAFKQDIVQAKWDSVLKSLCKLSLPSKKLIDLYEQIIMELIEMNELSAARSLLRQTDPMQVLKNLYPDRYLKLEELISQGSLGSSRIVYESLTSSDTTSKDERRRLIAEELGKELMVVAPSRLLTLLSESIQWEMSQGMIQRDMPYDLYKGAVPLVHAEDDAPPTQQYATVKFPKQQHAECAAFSPDGHFFATGSVDGIIEIWNYMTGKLRKDLKYQAEEEFMFMDRAVLSLSFSPDSETLASGGQDGKIKIWKVRTGQCVKRIAPAHAQGVTSLFFTPDGTQILSTSFDGLIKLHGLKSGRMMKEYRGHSSFVNDAIVSVNGQKIASGSSDGTVRIWDTKATDSLTTIYLQDGKMAFSGVHSPAVNQILLHPGRPDQFIICNRSPYLYTISFKGQVIKSYTHEKKQGADFVAVACSPKGEFLYGACEDGHVYCFNTAKGNMVSSFQVTTAEIVGSSSHPFSNIIALFDEKGSLSLWK